MIKILFFIDKLSYNGFIGGAEKVLINLVNRMDYTKFDITVQTLFPDRFSADLNSQIKYKCCYPKKNKVTEKICRVEIVLGTIYKKYIKDEYDIEVAFLEFESTKIMSYSDNKKAKKIAWVHCDFGVAIENKQEFARKEDIIYKRFDRVVCVSERSKKSFIEMFGNEQKVYVLYNVIDSEEIIRKSNISISNAIQKSDRVTLCSVGRFSPPKNHIRLLKAVNELIKTGFDFELWLIGDGNLRTEIETFISNNYLDNYVILLGFQNNPYPYMAQADILVCSSNYEGFSTFITEGLILGKPIITTDCSGMRELLGNSQYGIIVDNSDESFKNGLENILNSGEDRLKEMAQLSRKRGEDFNSAKLTSDIEQYLRNLIIA